MNDEHDAPERREKHTELWDEIRRVRDRVHEHSSFIAVMQSRVSILEEIERGRWAKMIAVVGLVSGAVTFMVQLIFQIKRNS